MPAKENTVKTTDLTAVRAVDFVNRFANEIAIVKNLFPNIRMIRRKPGEQLYSRKAEVTLNDTPVGEGEEIPYNEVVYTNVPVGTIDFDKQSIGVSLEAIAKSGYQAAVQAADDNMLFKMENKIVGGMMTFMQTGTLESDYTTTDLASAIAEAVGQVSNKWETMSKGYSEIVGFCNTLDLFRYFGATPITTQREFGLEYIKDFMGVSKLFYTSRIPSGKVIATAAENVIMDYIDVGDGDFNKAGFNFVTDGELNLVGVQIDAKNNKVVSESIMVYGIGIRAEYLDGIAVINIGENTPKVTLDKTTATVAAGSTTALTATTVPAGETVTWTSSDADVATVANGVVTGVAAGTATITAKITVDGTDYTATCAVTVSGV